MFWFIACSEKQQEEIAESAPEAEPARPAREEGKVGKVDARLDRPTEATGAEAGPPPDAALLGAKGDDGPVGLVIGEAPARSGPEASVAGLEQALQGVGSTDAGSGSAADGVVLGLGSRGAAGGSGDAQVGGRSGALRGASGASGYGKGGGNFGAEAVPERPAAPVSRPRADRSFGGTVWLSNDDAMSLASPQRLLWAVEHGQAVRTADIRPHEFLNYFSFDAPGVPAGAPFGVEAAARLTGDDSLSLEIEVAAPTPPRRPLDLTLVIDRSGSMSSAGKMAFLQRGLRRMAEELVAGDIVRVVSFDDRVELPLPEHRVGEDPRAELLAAFASLEPRGSTDLDAGLRKGLALARAGRADRERRVILVTDALLNTGQVDVGLVSDIGKAMEEADVHLSAVGVGADVDDRVLDMLSEKGRGAYVFLGSEAVVDRVFGPMFPSLVQTVAEDVHASVTLPPSLGMKRFYGEEMSTSKADVQAVSLHAGRAQLYLQDLVVGDLAAAKKDQIGFHLEWTDRDGRRQSLDRDFAVAALLRADDRDLRKARALMAWTDELTQHARHGARCGDDYATWRTRAAAVEGDAELRWLDGLLSKACGGAEPVVRAPLKVKVDADQPIAEVVLQCGGERWTDTLGAGDTVARFEAARGSCDLVLVGNTPMLARVRVPSTGAELRCRVRAGAVDCSG